MFCHDEPALKLAALALQAERGDCSSSPTGPAPRVRVEDYVPARVSTPGPPSIHFVHKNNYVH